MLKNYLFENFKRDKGINQNYFKIENNINIVIITLDRTFNYEKLKIAAGAIENGSKFFAANIDDTCLVENSEVLDAGLVISALGKRTKRKLELHFGKPSEFMIEEIRKRLNFENEKTLIIGDRLETDIAMGKIMSVDTALVSTDVKNALNGNRNPPPTYQLNSIADLLDKESDSFKPSKLHSKVQLQ